jgi:hypothetical protein
MTVSVQIFRLSSATPVTTGGMVEAYLGISRPWEEEHHWLSDLKSGIFSRWSRLIEMNMPRRWRGI